MEVLSNNIINNEDVYNRKKYKSDKNKMYITVNLFNKQWRVKPEAENTWLKIAKIEDIIRDNISHVLGAIGVLITGFAIYMLMCLYS